MITRRARCRTRLLCLAVSAATFLVVAFPVSAAHQVAASIRTIQVWPSPSFLALDPTTTEIYVRSNGTLDRYGNPVSNGAISALDGRSGRIVHVWPDVQGVPTISWLDFVHTSNGLQAYHFPRWLEVLVPRTWGGVDDIEADSHTGHLFGFGPAPTPADLSFLTVNIREDRIIQQVVLRNQGAVDMVAAPQSGRVILATARNTMSSSTTFLHIFDAQTGHLLTSTTRQGEEVALAVDGQAQRLLLYLDGSLQVFTMDSLHLLASIPIQRYVPPYYVRVPWYPEPLAVDTTIGRAIAINQDPNDPTAQIIDVRTGHILYTIPVGQQPLAVQTDPVLHRAYIIDYQSDDAMVVDLRTGKQVADVPTGNGPWAVAVDSPSGEVFVANSGVGDNSVTMFPANITQK